ncbi:MAG: hypothetical protein U0R76_07695 [Candidatus Nanopelagicales bacterium]
MTDLAHVASGFPVVGVVGGGQLARMMQQPAIALGVGLRVLATSIEESAAQAVRDVRIGRHDDLDDLRAFADGCDVITFDHEHVPPLLLKALEDDGVAVRPGGRALVHAQDKLIMREALTAAGVPCPLWAEVETPSDVAAAEQAGWPVVLRRPRAAGTTAAAWVLDDLERPRPHDVDDPRRWCAVACRGARRLRAGASAQVARSPHGQAVAYPVVRAHRSGTNRICTEVVAKSASPTTRSPPALDGCATCCEALDAAGGLATRRRSRTATAACSPTSLVMRLHTLATIDRGHHGRSSRNASGALLDLGLRREQRHAGWPTPGGDGGWRSSLRVYLTAWCARPGAQDPHVRQGGAAGRASSVTSPWSATTSTTCSPGRTTRPTTSRESSMSELAPLSGDPRPVWSDR